MYTLRRITSQSAEINESLGEAYNLTLKERTPDDFNKVLNLLQWNEEVAENLHGFIICFNGSKTIPLYKKSHYFVMTENGKTFDNLTYKG